MPPKHLKWLEDLREAASFILEQTGPISLQDYRDSRLISAAVERHFIIIGEALSRISRQTPDVAARIGEHPQIIAFRNILVHGYDMIDHAIVWGIIRNELGGLMTIAESLLNESEQSGDDE